MQIENNKIFNNYDKFFLKDCVLKVNKIILYLKQYNF